MNALTMNTATPRYPHPGGFNPVLTMTSREIAELASKHHFHVTTDIEKMLLELGAGGAGLVAPAPACSRRGGAPGGAAWRWPA